MYDFMESPRGYFLMYDFNFDPLPHLLSYYFHQKKKLFDYSFPKLLEVFLLVILEEFFFTFMSENEPLLQVLTPSLTF